ncbi:MAG: hypothetical protein HZA00_11860 [Nitrospinae bacterium]|nr:hypothetical protein [Nitrospinota bacterium]
MNYDNFLHICRAVLEITKAREVIILGFNAITPWLKDKGMVKFEDNEAKLEL